MRIVGNIARHGKPLTVAVLVLFAFLTGYTSFHYHTVSNCHGNCSVQQTAHDSGDEVAASQTECNICFYAATPRIMFPAERTGVVEARTYIPSVPEQSTPCYNEEYTSPLRGPPALSLI